MEAPYRILWRASGSNKSLALGRGLDAIRRSPPLLIEQDNKGLQPGQRFTGPQMDAFNLRH